MTLNAEWHLEHPLPKNATQAERVTWHKAHAKVCGCHKMPASIAALIAAQDKKKPEKVATKAKAAPLKPARRSTTPRKSGRA